MSAAGDSTEQTDKGSSPQQQTPASDNGASGSASVQDILEDQLRTLHQQINNSDWLQNNTAEKWMEANPEAAAQLKKIFSEKEASRNAAQTESNSKDSPSSEKS